MQIGPVMIGYTNRQTGKQTEITTTYIYIYKYIIKLCAPVIRLYCWTIAVPSSTVNSSPPVTIYKHFNPIDKNFANYYLKTKNKVKKSRTFKGIVAENKKKIEIVTFTGTYVVILRYYCLLLKNPLTLIQERFKSLVFFILKKM